MENKDKGHVVFPRLFHPPTKDRGFGRTLIGEDIWSAMLSRSNAQAEFEGFLASLLLKRRTVLWALRLAWMNRMSRLLHLMDFFSNSVSSQIGAFHTVTH